MRRRTCPKRGQGGRPGATAVPLRVRQSTVGRTLAIVSVTATTTGRTPTRSSTSDHPAGDKTKSSTTTAAKRQTFTVHAKRGRSHPRLAKREAARRRQGHGPASPTSTGIFQPPRMKVLRLRHSGLHLAAPLRGQHRGGNDAWGLDHFVRTAPAPRASRPPNDAGALVGGNGHPTLNDPTVAATPDGHRGHIPNGRQRHRQPPLGGNGPWRTSLRRLRRVRHANTRSTPDPTTTRSGRRHADDRVGRQLHQRLRSDFDGRYRATFPWPTFFPTATAAGSATTLTGDVALKGARLAARSGRPTVDSRLVSIAGHGLRVLVEAEPEVCFQGAFFTQLLCGAGQHVAIDPQVGWEQQKFLTP